MQFRAILNDVDCYILLLIHLQLYAFYNKRSRIISPDPKQRVLLIYGEISDEDRQWRSAHHLIMITQLK